MNSEIQIRLLRAVHAVIRPLARVLLRSGITYRQFESVSKLAFIEEAFAERDHRGRRANISRVAVRTALSRKEVKKIRDSNEYSLDEGAIESLRTAGPPAKVLHAWHTDPRFVDELGQPRVLAFEGGTDSFAALVKSVAGDVPPGAVRAELNRVGAIAEASESRIQVVKRYYVPTDVDEKAVVVLSHLLHPLTEGLAHNSDPRRTTGGFIQRFAFSDNLDPDALPLFRKLARSRSEEFLESIDDWLGGHNDPARRVSSDELRVGVGVFYYEGPAFDSRRNAEDPGNSEEGAEVND